ncbi:MAG: apolipoprotein N-acyltransferase [Neisseria sp.]|nr:apolipoprotein N-acyltransferase [Neisseria sp.]
MKTSLSARLEAFWRRPPVYWLLLPLLAAATPLAFAPYYHFWLMPLLFAAFVRLLELRPEVRVRSAYLFGLAAYTAQFYWIYSALHDVAGLPDLYALPLTLLLPVYLAIYPAAAVWLWEKVRLNRWLHTGIALPVFWTLAEFARERLLTGFGWGALGYSQIADSSPLAGFAPVGGIHLVTLLTAATGAWLTLIVDNEGRLKARFAALSALFALLFAGHALYRTDFTRPAGAPATVALAQGNIPQKMKFSEEQLVFTLQRYYDQIASAHADIVILPETALPMLLQEIPEGIINQFADQAQRNGSALALGVLQYTADGRDYLNAVINLSDYSPETPENIPYYAKDHLVPFGEYKPLPGLTSGLYSLMNMPMSDIKRGGVGQKPFDMANQKVAFNICYEDGFGDDLIPSAAQATLLANSSNLAWFGRSNAMYQHLQQSQARSLEFGRYMVRATNTGATAIIDNKGRITNLAPADTPFVLEGEIQGFTGETPYMRLGGSLPLIALLAFAALLLLVFGRKGGAAVPPQGEAAAAPASDGEK